MGGGQRLLRLVEITKEKKSRLFKSVHINTVPNNQISIKCAFLLNQHVCNLYL